MHPEGKPMTGPMIIEKAKYFYDEVKITHKRTFRDGWQSSNKKLSVRNLLHNPEYLLTWHMYSVVGAAVKAFYCIISHFSHV